MKSPKINNSKGGHVIVEKVRYMISDAAALAGVETHVLRYWEEELDLTIPRNEMGHRYYTRENIQEFQKIKELKEKGYQLKAIRMILHNKNPEDAGVSVPDSAAPGPLPACNREHHHTVVAKPNRQNTDKTDLPVNTLSAEERMAQFRELMSDIVGHAIAQNNEALTLDISKEIRETVLKEMNYLIREQNDMTEERYRQLFKDVKDANMNMIRVWGGGIYEDDAFYQAADENGILVWQDFIFACTTYPSDPAFMKRVEAEAEYNIKRLRNHASLAMWCGNNEIYEGMRYWGWDKKYTDPGIMEGMKQGYDKLFRELLPRKVAELDPDRFYMHGSPYEANWGRPESWKIADSHNWGIWYGQKPFESLDTEIPRFMSEFGFQAFPEMKTIATFASPEDYALESEVMNAHQKATIGNFLIKKTMGLYYKVPEDFDQLVYMGLVLQGVGVRQGLEAHRRNRPYCMGTLYWQLNDSWPVVSWSSIDYYGNWKALHYQAKRAFAPVLVDAVKEGEDLNIYVMSDKLEADKEVTLLLRVMDFNGKVLTKKSIKGEVPANASTLYYKEPYAGMTTSPQNTFLLMTLKNKKGEVLSEEIYYFNHAKDQELPKTEIRYKVKPMDGKYEVTLSARQLARDVFIEIPVQGARFTDNFFDLLPGQTKKVIITSDKLKKNEKVDITIKQLSDTN